MRYFRKDIPRYIGVFRRKERKKEKKKENEKKEKYRANICVAILHCKLQISFHFSFFFFLIFPLFASGIKSFKNGIKYNGYLELRKVVALYSFCIVRHWLMVKQSDTDFPLELWMSGWRKPNTILVTNHHPAAILNPCHFATATCWLDKNVTFVFYPTIFYFFVTIFSYSFVQIRVHRHFLRIRTIIFNDYDFFRSFWCLFVDSFW